jgi:hypothetical protein
MIMQFLTPVSMKINMFGLYCKYEIWKFYTRHAKVFGVIEPQLGKRNELSEN